MANQILLKNGCKASKPSVTPKNWKTGGKELLLKNWNVQYYFTDPNFPKPKQVRKKGMNSYKTLKERRAATQFILDEINKMLKLESFNPITKVNMTENINATSNTVMPSALDYAYQNYKASDNRKANVKSMLKYFKCSAESLGFAYVPIKDITRRNIKDILRHQERTRGISEDRYNKYLSMLRPLFDILIEDEVIENNPTDKIRKYSVIRKERKVLSIKERNVVYKHLKENYYTFWRFMMIFFSSGAREAELVRLKVKDVDLKNLEYKVFVKKGKLNKKVTKPINKNISYLWREVLSEQEIVNDEDFVFSKGLICGDHSIRPEQITRRWKAHVKDKLGIEADFYALKHLNLDETIEKLSMKDAQKLASHTSDKMLIKHYAVGEEKRRLERLKNVNIPFLKEEKQKILKVV
ncbi:site-specific integrase [Tenacibaculum maritimum]|uniref:site-specific integrase n=1 Tax=Tenacibaculum maritimum TaxID=107401 RepID=UPI0012E51C7B|nr:tyrosine-type recombinase/integrase [Tenacibaculum maritimum]CAA0144337.1 Site-specific recombinase, phage integrase family [Tenacibaculum maritimum]CAA0194153.1 Site-specific recombinase, phage integrase family [Tenacibaculum maritimum]CAA0195768.1 Site-specific recombinase, phage integrase family [Tenacibaculum maritimum]